MGDRKRGRETEGRTTLFLCILVEKQLGGVSEETGGRWMLHLSRTAQATMHKQAGRMLRQGVEMP